MSAYSPYGISSTSPVINLGATRLNGLDDVGISSATNGQALVYNSSTGLWTNGTISGGGGGSTTLAALTDVNLSSPDNLSYLKYDTATSKWINNNPFGNLRITNNNNIGTVNDNDLMTLADNLVTVRGSLNFDSSDPVTLQNIGTGAITIQNNGSSFTTFRTGSDTSASGFRYRNLSNQDIFTIGGDRAVRFPTAAGISMGDTNQFVMVRQASNMFVTNSTGNYEFQNSSTTGQISFKVGATTTAASFDIRTPTNTNIFSFKGDGSQTGLTLAKLNDAAISSPTNGQALVYNSSTGLWVNGTVSGGGSSTLAGLSDVTLSSPDNLSYLKYDTATSKWVNNNPFGNLRISNGNDIGTATDSDLMTLTDNLVTLRGSLNFDSSSAVTLQNIGTGQVTIKNNGTTHTILQTGSDTSASGFRFRNLSGQDIFTVSGDRVVRFPDAVSLSMGTTNTFTMTRDPSNFFLTNTQGNYFLTNSWTLGRVIFKTGSLTNQTGVDILDSSNNVKFRFNSDGSQVGINLAGLGGVSLSSPSSGQVLSYNGTNWVNSAPSGTGNIVFTGSDIGISTDTNLMTVADNVLTVRNTLEITNPSLVNGGILSLSHNTGQAFIFNSTGDFEIVNEEAGKDVNIRANAINLRNDSNTVIARMFNSHFNLPEGFYQSFGNGSVGPLQIVRDSNLSQISSNANRLLILNSASGQNTDIKGSNIRFLDLSDVVKLQTSAAGINMVQDQVFSYGSSDQLQISRKTSKSQILNILNDLELENTATNSHIICKLGTTSNATAFKIKDSANADKFVFNADGTQTGINLAGLGGVSLSSPSSNQVLTYNGTNWVNSTPSGGTGSWTINSSGLCTSTNSIDFRHSNWRVMDTNGISCLEMVGTSGMRIPNTKLLGYGANDEFGMHYTGSEGYIRVNSGVLRLRAGGSQLIQECNQMVGQMSSGGQIFFAARRNDASFILDNAGQQVFSISVNNGSTPIAALTIQNDTGNVNIPNLTSSSDDRDKIWEEPSDLGLSFINQLQPMKYRFDRRADYPEGQSPDGSKKDSKWDYGLIAQQLAAIAPPDTKFVQESGPEQLSVAYLQLICPMVKAIQELSTKVAILESQLASLQP